MKSYTLLNKYSLITVVLFISSILNSEAASKSSDSLFDILKNEKMSVEQRIGSARNSTFFFQMVKSEQDFLRFCSLGDAWYNANPSNDRLYLVTYFKCEWYTDNGKIGEIFVLADKFKQQVEIHKIKRDIIHSLVIYNRAFEYLGLYKELAENSRKLYHLRKYIGTVEEKAGTLSSYCWTLNNCGFYLKDQKLLDSCVFYHELFRSTMKEFKLNYGIYLNNYSIYILVLKRMKSFNKTLEITKEAILFVKTNVPNKNELNDALASFYGSVAYAKFFLGETDSALYYSDLSAKLNKNIVSIGEGAIYFLSKLKRFDEAVLKLYPLIFGNEKSKSPNLYNYHCGFAAPIFESAGRYKEAAYCYNYNKSFSDSIRKLENESNEEYNQLKTKFVIASERESARLASEKIETENTKEKEKKNLIIILGSITGVIIIVFMIIIYGRYRLTEKQNAIIESQKFILENKNEIIEGKQREIIDSINYAKRIQYTLLAHNEFLQENLREYFVYFEPKDIVSGDFYWATKIDNLFYLAVCDSTGHGVPGAIMSILNISCLENAIKEGNTEPAEILNHTRKNIIDRLKKDGSKEGGKDGMDASLICFDFKSNKLTYAAANNPVWIVRGKELLEFAPDKMPVGKHDKDATPFSQHQIDLQKGDVVYTLTDGMPDQFGGPKGKKFMYKQLKELLVSIASMPMNEQKEKLQSSLNNWKGDLEQVDDVCIIGVRI